MLKIVYCTWKYLKRHINYAIVNAVLIKQFSTERDINAVDIFVKTHVDY